MTAQNLTLKFYKTVLAVFFGSVFFLVSFTTVLAATLSASPSTGVYTAGGTFTTRIVVNTSGQAINAAEGTLKFDPSTLSVVSLSKGSIFSLWAVEPTFSNSAGTISFGGGSPTGYTGSAGTVLSVTFRAKAAGTAKVTFSNGSVLAADGRGTNVLTAMNSGSYTIAAAEVAAEPEVIEYIAPPNTPAAPQVSSNTHPDPAGWYAKQTAQLSWTLPAGVTAIRTLLDDKSGSIPTKVYDTPPSSIELNDLDEGVQYFHIQFKNDEGWGRVTHYRLAVDTVAPSRFDIAEIEGADRANPEPEFNLITEDEGSGVIRFMVQLDGAEPYEFVPASSTSTLTLTSLAPGHHTLVIEAFDAAGNSLVATRSFSVESFDKPQFTDYPSQINEEVIPVIKGITRSGATVYITLTKVGAQPAEYEVVADDAGVFTFIPEGTLSQGVYEIKARAVDAYGAQSETSETVRIAVQQPGYLRIGNLVVSILSVLVPLLAIVLLLFLAVIYFLARVRTIRTTVVRESKEALDILEREFVTLHKLMDAEKQALEKSRKTKKLTKAEEHLIVSLSKSLTSAHDRIKTELEEVDDIVE
ncbi:hypothetical protein H6783_03195 [Candidatus Nomurabacteria bacterium]|nr:hypothetical protein [Candidatus Nomurabacteria bacterium]